MIIHSEIRPTPFPCELCGKQYGTKYRLKAHLETHAGRKYSCELCNRKFNQPQNLKRHRQIHTGKIQLFLFYDKFIKSINHILISL